MPGLDLLLRVSSAGTELILAMVFLFYVSFVPFWVCRRWLGWSWNHGVGRAEREHRQFHVRDILVWTVYVTIPLSL